MNTLSGLLDKSPLHLAVEGGHLDAVKSLIKCGADINATGLHVIVHICVYISILMLIIYLL